MKQSLAEMYAENPNIKALAEATGINHTTLRHVLLDSGVKLTRRRKRAPVRAHAYATVHGPSVVAEFEAGVPQEDTCCKHGIDVHTYTRIIRSYRRALVLKIVPKDCVTMYLHGASVRSLAKHYQVGVSSIYTLLYGQGIKPREEKTGRKAKIDPRLIYRQYLMGTTTMGLAEMFNVNIHTVYKAIKAGRNGALSTSHVRKSEEVRSDAHDNASSPIRSRVEETVS